jgi:hypothetical protein
VDTIFEVASGSPSNSSQVGARHARRPCFAQSKADRAAHPHTPHRERGAWQEISTAQRIAAHSHQQELLDCGGCCCCDERD